MGILLSLFTLQLLLFLPHSESISSNSTESDLEYLQNKYDQLFAPDMDSDSGLNSRTILPDLSEITAACSRKEFFASFNPMHMKAVNMVKDLFLRTTSLEEWFILALALRKNPAMNPKLWFYAVTSYMYNSNQMQGIRKIPPWAATPDDYFIGAAIELARCAMKPSSSCTRKCVRLDESFSNDNGVESVLWYFREDIFVNADHWYYHLAYPTRSRFRADRTGELFYFFHQQLVARYNAERFSNGLARVRAFDLRVGVIEEGYYAHMRDDNSGLNWTDRAPNAPFGDTVLLGQTSNVSIAITNVTKARNRIFGAIENDFIVAKNGTQVPLSSFRGVDLLGDIVQAKNFSLNPDYYGPGAGGAGLHNEVHEIFGASMDPKGKLGLPSGVMSSDNTAVRDPIFFRWHQYVNDIFDQHKRKLKPYAPSGGDFPLLWNGVSVESLKVISKKSGTLGPIVENQLFTFWNMKKLFLTHGLDYVRSGLVRMCVKHLDHSPFKYEFVITKKSSVKATRAMVRVFLAPRYKESGERFRADDQRFFFISLDSFFVPLKTGENVIRRGSTESTVTIAFDQSYSHIQAASNSIIPNCGCGWPQHLLLPKGTALGMTYDLFVMVTNGDEDQIGVKPSTECREAHVYCGLINQKYPDAKPMGYPFDRSPYSGEDSTIDEFMAGISNMRSIQVRIFHTDKS